MILNRLGFDMIFLTIVLCVFLMIGTFLMWGLIAVATGIFCYGLFYFIFHSGSEKIRTHTKFEV